MKRECKRCVFTAGSILILIIAGFVAYNYSKTIGSVTYPVEANRQFLAASFSCANGASSDLTSKNCRSAAYWKNFADKFCRNLCEPTEDMNLDNVNVGTDHSCDMSVLRLFKECEGNVVQPVSPGSVEAGGDCTEDAECISGNCEGEPYGICGEMPTTTTIITTFPTTAAGAEFWGSISYYVCNSFSEGTRIEVSFVAVNLYKNPDGTYSLGEGSQDRITFSKLYIDDGFDYSCLTPDHSNLAYVKNKQAGSYQDTPLSVEGIKGSNVEPFAPGTGEDTIYSIDVFKQEVTTSAPVQCPQKSPIPGVGYSSGTHHVYCYDAGSGGVCTAYTCMDTGQWKEESVGRYNDAYICQGGGGPGWDLNCIKQQT